MSLITRLSHTFNAALKAWSESANAVEQPQTPGGTTQQPGVNAYYVDTMAKAGEDLSKLIPPPVSATTTSPVAVINQGRVETHLDDLTAAINAELAKPTQDFDRLQVLIYKVIMLTMRLAAKTESEQIREFSFKIKNQAQEIKATYNNWQGLTVTVISAGVSVAGGLAGLSPFMPFEPQVAQALQMASQSIGTAGTGLSGIGSIFNNRSEGTRQVEQLNLKSMQDKEQDHKEFKQHKNDLLKTAKATADEFDRNKHQANTAAAAA